MTKGILLASSSPNRAKILQDAGLMYLAAKPDVDESLFDIRGEVGPEVVRDYVLNLSELKAEEVYGTYLKMNQGLPAHKINVVGKAETYASDVELDLLVAADSSVYYGGLILGKPESAAEARDMLYSIRNGRLEFYTGMTLIDLRTGAKKQDMTISAILMADYTDAMVEQYIATGEPYRGAGGFLPGRKGAILLQSIMGDYHNVQGLSMIRLRQVMQSMGYLISDYWCS